MLYTVKPCRKSTTLLVVDCLHVRGGVKKRMFELAMLVACRLGVRQVFDISGSGVLG